MSFPRDGREVEADARLAVAAGFDIIATGDHAMAGVPPWSAAERVTRLAEFVQALDGALRGEESFDGQIYRFSGASWSPGPVQQPRPPIAVGAVGPRMLRLAAEQADVWSAFGGIAVEDEEAFFASLQDQIRTLDQACQAHGRDPKSLRRSLLAFRPLAPWRSIQTLEQVALRAHHLGFDELILYKPADADEMQVLEQATETLAD